MVPYKGSVCLFFCITQSKFKFMARKSKKGKKHNLWTAQEEERLIANVENHVLCLTKAFEITSKEIGRTPGAVSGHWYQKTSMKCGRTLFATVSGKHVAVNRKNSNGNPLSLPLYKRVLKILGLSY